MVRVLQMCVTKFFLRMVVRDSTLYMCSRGKAVVDFWIIQK